MISCNFNIKITANDVISPYLSIEIHSEQDKYISRELMTREKRKSIESTKTFEAQWPKTKKGVRCTCNDNVKSLKFN